MHVPERNACLLWTPNNCSDCLGQYCLLGGASSNQGTTFESGVEIGIPDMLASRGNAAAKLLLANELAATALALLEISKSVLLFQASELGPRNTAVGLLLLLQIVDAHVTFLR